MKKYFFVFLFLSPLLSFAQDFFANAQYEEEKYSLITLSNFKTYGYYHHTRLDSIASNYATAQMSYVFSYLPRHCSFCIGDTTSKKTDERLFDKEGIPVRFNSIINFLNFLDYNSWVAKTIIYDDNDNQYHTKQDPTYLFARKVSSP